MTASKLPALCLNTADGAGFILKKDPKSDAEDWEKETDYPKSRITIYAHNYVRCYAGTQDCATTCSE